MPAILRGIYSFHVKGRGWSDIGYNFLIDRFGRTWEGRYGGISQPVIGAHTGGYNSQLFGAAAIGTYSSTTPPTAVLDAYKRLLAWKLGLHHVDPATSVLLDGMSSKVYTVSGHQDADGTANQTACPGAALYSKLSTLRAGAKSLQGTTFYEPKVSSTSWFHGASGPTLTAWPSKSLTWSLQVKSPCRTETLATVTGSATTTGGIKATWNGKLSSGAWAPPGEYDLTLTATSGSGSSTTPSVWTARVRVVGTASSPPGFCPDRLAGADRYATAVAVARSANPSATTVVLANGTDAGMADALVAAPLAKLHATAPAPGRPDEPARLGALRDHPPQGQDGAPRRQRRRDLHRGRDPAEGPGHHQHPRATAAATATPRRQPSRRWLASPDVMVSSGVAMADGLALSGPAAHLGGRSSSSPRTRCAPPLPACCRSWAALRTVVAGSAGVVSDQVLAQHERHPGWPARPLRHLGPGGVVGPEGHAGEQRGRRVGEDQALVDTCPAGSSDRRRSTCDHEHAGGRRLLARRLATRAGDRARQQRRRR